jgi:urea transport system permease protein
MRNLFLALFCLFAFAAHAAVDPALVQALGAEESDDKIAAIDALVKTGDPEALTILKQLDEGTLKDANGEDITINNRVRGKIGEAMAALRLFDPDAKTRLAATKELLNNVDAGMAPMLDKARAAEAEPRIKALLEQAYALATVRDADPEKRIAALKALAASGDANVRTMLLDYYWDKKAEPNLEIRRVAFASYLEVKDRLNVADFVGKVFSGLSLGSILLLAALGLAITYGVMGVINMAHGELLMIGAYATYAMQSLFRAYLPNHIDWYVLAAVPVAFFAAAAVGILLERTVIRRLYGRPLETLLATWGLSLILIQAARVFFGAQNVEVANPSWMSGGIEVLPNIVLPLNRIVIIGFSLFVLSLVWVLMNKTRLGMFVRAVTQNRPMAGCVGVPTSRVDTLAFGLGAGIAGLGGVALSQIANVGPDMGQGYIVDSFLVVVVGGVGQLAGAVWAALGLGVIAKFLEGWTGAVIAKIAVLVFVIIFIQRRPQGIFALKGRFVES